MGVVALLSAVALAAVFAVSGIAKLLDPGGTREAVSGFGVPPRLAALVAAGLAPAELVVALLLVIPASAPVGLGLALLLLAGFTGAVVVALRAGRRPECHCFGRIGGADISARTVVRNGVLAALAVLGLVGTAAGGRPEGSALAAAVVAGLALGAAIIALEGLAGQRARRRRDAEAEAIFEAGVGSEPGVAPDFRLPTLAGDEVTLEKLLAPGLPVLLVSLSPGCGPCARLRPEVARWVEAFASRLSVVVLASGTPEANRPGYADMPHLPVLLDDAGIREPLGLSATPSAIVIDPDGRIVSAVAMGENLVRRLLVTALTGVEANPSLLDEDEDAVPADELDQDSVVRPRDTVQLHDLGEKAVLLDIATGATVLLDQVGRIIWSVLDGQSRLREIASDVAVVFGAPEEVVANDLVEMARTLGQAGVLAGVAPVAPKHDPDEATRDHDHAQGHGHEAAEAGAH